MPKWQLKKEAISIVEQVRRVNVEISLSKEGGNRSHEFDRPFSNLRRSIEEGGQRSFNGDGKRERRKEEMEVRRQDFAEGRLLFARLRCRRQTCEEAVVFSRRFAANWKRQWPIYTPHLCHRFFFFISRCRTWRKRKRKGEKKGEKRKEKKRKKRPSNDHYSSPPSFPRFFFYGREESWNRKICKKPRRIEMERETFCETKQEWRNDGKVGRPLNNWKPKFWNLRL